VVHRAWYSPTKSKQAETAFAIACAVCICSVIAEKRVEGSNSTERCIL
jgi:hypothetical protein